MPDQCRSFAVRKASGAFHSVRLLAICEIRRGEQRIGSFAGECISRAIGENGSRLGCVRENRPRVGQANSGVCIARRNGCPVSILGTARVAT